MKTVFIIYTLFLLAVFVLNGGITQASNQDSLTREAAHSETPVQNPGSNLSSEAHHR
jgi:hypothetical protein